MAKQETVPKDGDLAKVFRATVRGHLKNDKDLEVGYALTCAIIAQELGYPELALEVIQVYGLEVRTYDAD